MIGEWNPAEFMVVKCLFIEIMTANILKFLLKEIKMFWVHIGNFEEKRGLLGDKDYMFSTLLPEILNYYNLAVVEG